MAEPLSRPLKRLVPLVLAALFVQAVAAAGLFASADDRLAETRMQVVSRSASGAIAFVAIDRNSLDTVGVWPWPRRVHAEAIDALLRQGADDIFLDIDFSTPSNRTDDSLFKAALDRAGGGVLLPSFAQTSTVEERAETVTGPIAEFADASWPVSVNVVPERDGIVRKLQPRTVLGNEEVPSAPSVLAGREDRTKDIRVDYSIDPSTIPSHSFADLLAGRIPADALRGRKVVVGAHALELRDTFAVPVHRTVPGPVLQILGAETLLQNRALEATQGWVVLLIAGLVVVVAVSITFRARLPLRLLVLIGVSAILEAAALLLQVQTALVLPTAGLHALVAAIAVATILSEVGLGQLLLLFAARELQTTRRLLEQVFADTSDGVVVLDRHGTVLEQNETYGRMTGVGHGASVLREFIGALGERMRARADGEREEGELTLPSGTVMQYIATASRLPDKASSALLPFVFVNLRDVSEAKRREAALSQLSRHDKMTGALQRHAFVEAMRERKECGKLVVLDACGVARINAHIGRAAGDEIVQVLAERLKRAPGVVAGPARLSGATFAVALSPDEPLDSLRRTTERAVVFDASHIPISCRWGVSSATAGAPEAMLEEAEMALDLARTRGTAKPVVYDAADTERAARRHRLERDMHSSLKAGRFWVAYQMQVRANDGTPCGAEALVRWDHPELGFVSPGEFIEIAEASGFIDELGAFVMKQACLDAVSWPSDLSISVNVAAGQLARGKVIPAVREALEASGLEPARLDIELTESSFMDDADDLVSQLEALRALGVTLALDDFGTGYSSLGYLARFPLSKIKLDQIFVRNVAESPASLAILRSTQTLARGLGLGLLCEGVETEADWKAVREAGAAEIQGYFFAKPVPVDVFAALLDDLHDGRAAA